MYKLEIEITYDKNRDPIICSMESSLNCVEILKGQIIRLVLTTCEAFHIVGEILVKMEITRNGNYIDSDKTGMKISNFYKVDETFSVM